MGETTPCSLPREEFLQLAFEHRNTARHYDNVRLPLIAFLVTVAGTLSVVYFDTAKFGIEETKEVKFVVAGAMLLFGWFISSIVVYYRRQFFLHGTASREMLEALATLQQTSNNIDLHDSWRFNSEPDGEMWKTLLTVWREKSFVSWLANAVGIVYPILLLVLTANLH